MNYEEISSIIQAYNVDTGWTYNKIKPRITNVILGFMVGVNA